MSPPIQKTKPKIKGDSFEHMVIITTKTKMVATCTKTDHGCFRKEILKRAASKLTLYIVTCFHLVFLSVCLCAELGPLVTMTLVTTTF